MDGEKIGIEVTELVDTNAIKEHPKNPRYGGREQFLREFAIPLPRLWSSDKLEKELVAIVRRKDEKGKSNSLSKQFLLIVTDEPGLDLKGHPKTGQRRSPQNRPMKAARDQVVLPRLAVIGQACFGTPTPWATLENVAMMEEAVEHGSHGGTIP